jgi:hypothetical protein
VKVLRCGVHRLLQAVRSAMHLPQLKLLARQAGDCCGLTLSGAITTWVLLEAGHGVGWPESTHGSLFTSALQGSQQVLCGDCASANQHCVLVGVLPPPVRMCCMPRGARCGQRSLRRVRMASCRQLLWARMVWRACAVCNSVSGVRVVSEAGCPVWRLRVRQRAAPGVANPAWVAAARTSSLASGRECMRGRDGCGGPLCASPALLCRVSITAERRGTEHSVWLVCIDSAR